MKNEIGIGRPDLSRPVSPRFSGQVEDHDEDGASTGRRRENRENLNSEVKIKCGNFILFFLVLSLSMLTIFEAIADNPESEVKDVGAEEVSEPPVEPESDEVSELGERFWTEGLRLSLGDGISTQPAICSLRSPTTSSYGSLGNEIYVIWSDSRVGQRDLFMRKSKDGGLTWDEEERLVSSKADSVRPVVASDKKQVHLVWEERHELGAEIIYKRWDGAGWSEELVLSKGLPNSRNPDIAVTTGSSNSTVYVVWETVRPRTAQAQIAAYLSRSEDGGVSWSKPLPIVSPIADDFDTPTWNTSEPKVAGDMGVAYVVWRDERELKIQPPLIKGGQIFIKRWDEVSVGDDIRLSDPGDYRRPDVSVSASSVYVVWEGSPDVTLPTVSDIFITESFDGGKTFSQALQITQSAAEATMPKIIALADDAWLFWQDGRMGNWEIFLTRKSFPAANWGLPEQFTQTETGIDSIMPVVTGSPGIPQEQIHLLWVARDSETRSHLIYSRRDTIPPLPPDKPVHLDMNAQKGYDNDGTLAFYWSHPAGIRNEKHEARSFIERPAKYNVYFTTALVSESFSPLTRFELAGTTEKLSYSFKVESGRTYSVAVEAVDEVGNVSELSEFSEAVFVDSHPPEVFIHFPKPNASLLSSTPVIATCLDNNLVEWRLQYKFTTIASVSWHEMTSEAFAWKLIASSNESVEKQRVASWDVSELNGVYTLELIAIDEAGNQSKSDISVVIDNTPPIPITAADFGAELLISDFGADYSSPAWSTDGSMIAYASNEGGAEDIWIFDLKQHTKNRLTHDTAFDANPVWSPDSRWLAFQSFENGNWNIWAISVDGSNRLPLVVDADAEPTMDTTPAWSPNGDQLAFIRKNSADDDGEIWLISNVDEVIQGGEANLFQLTQNEWEDSNPTWSQDGTKIAFQSNRHGNWDIFSITVNGFEEQLTDEVSNEIKPKWSPDGKRILFISDQLGSKSKIYGEIAPYRKILALEIHSGEIISLSAPGIDAEHADWSPDLKSMVYQSDNIIYITDFHFPIPKVEAIITRPYQGEYISSGQAQKAEESQDGLMDIIGIARGTNFKEYRLEYAKNNARLRLSANYNGRLRLTALNDASVSKLEWMPIGGVSTSQISYVGFLGRLDTRGLQGEYIIKLSVFGKKGDIAIDTVSIFIERERPRLVVTEPADGFVTAKPLIVVAGETEANMQITINDEPVDLESIGKIARFQTTLLLAEGENTITVVARRPTQEGMKSNLETAVQRHVFLDTQDVELNVETPKDFQIVNVPYVTVKGNAGRTVKMVKILETTVIGPEVQPYIAADYQTSPMKTFQRTILLHEGVNSISIEAIDQLNRLINIQRRVIYEKPDVIRRDINPPAIADIRPHDGTIITDTKLEISATLVDDVKILPETVAFTFDGEEIDPKNFEFNEEDGRFSYTTEKPFPSDGEHTFTISVQDTSDNSTSRTVKFFIDTEPAEITLSAQANIEDNSRLRIILTSNKPLQSIPTAVITPTADTKFRIPRLGYSINLNRVTSDAGDGKTKPFIFEGFFDTTPSQNTFKLDAVVVDKFGATKTVHGYYLYGSLYAGIATFLWSQMKLESPLTKSPRTPLIEEEHSESPQMSLVLERSEGMDEANRFSVSGIIEAIFPTKLLETVHNIILRSQDGLDLSRLAAQRQNAEDRRLEMIDIVHLVESEQQREEIQFILKLPIPKKKRSDQLREKFALFYWDAQLQRWEAVDATRSFSEGLPFSESKGWIQAKAGKFGAYALLADEIPPTIANLRPKNNQEVPMDRFLVEAEIYDDGSGIDKNQIELLIDDKPAEFIYEPVYNRISYLPANLKPGLHTLKLSVQDRASNIQTIYSTFFTSAIFAFAEEVIAYPNPAKKGDNVTVRFKLTQTADVTLKIYSVSGEIIYTEQKNSVVGQVNEWFVWDGKNQAEFPVASGVYIYIILAENSAGQKARRSGKIAVMK